MGKGRILATCVCAALGVSASTAAVADSFTVQTALDDTRLYFTAPLRWDREDWLYFAGTLAVVGAAHSLDTRCLLYTSRMCGTPPRHSKSISHMACWRCW